MVAYDLFNNLFLIWIENQLNLLLDIQNPNIFYWTQMKFIFSYICLNVYNCIQRFCVAQVVKCWGRPGKPCKDNPYTESVETQDTPVQYTL